MRRDKRQIIKTRPQRPYVIARVILALIIAVALALAAWFVTHPHPGHAFMLLQEAPAAERMAHIPPPLERTRS